MSNGWETIELAAVSAINYGYTESASSEPIGPRFLRITDIQDDRVDWDTVPYCKIDVSDLPKFRLASGDIVFARTGATTGKSFLVEEPPEAVFASYLIRLRLLHEKLLPQFVLMYFQTADYWQSIKEGSSGSAQGGFNATKLGALKIPLPPLPEQQRIVALLNEAFAGLATAKATAERNLQNARALFESHLQSVFSQRGDGWVEHTLGDLIEIQNGYAFKSTDYTDTGYFVIRISNVQDGEITLANPRFIKLADKKLDRFILTDGDILISLTGNIGRVGIIQEDQLPAVLNQRVARITIKDLSADRDFLFRFLLSRTFRESLQEAGHGAAQQNVSTKEVESVRLSLPNKEEQRRIAEEFDSFAVETQHLTRLYERKLAALEELKKSLLHQAFNGEL